MMHGKTIYSAHPKLRALQLSVERQGWVLEDVQCSFSHEHVDVWKNMSLQIIMSDSIDARLPVYEYCIRY